jgi:hypothetical protein
MSLLTRTTLASRAAVLLSPVLAAASVAALPTALAAGDGAHASSAAADPPAARAAGTLRVNDSAHMRGSGSGSDLIEEGYATGTMPGRVRASLLLGASTVRVGFTVYLRNGQITGHGTARLNTGHGAYASFGGSLVVSHGTGHYAHVSGSGGLYGTIDRENYSAVVQVIGTLRL